MKRLPLIVLACLVAHSAWAGWVVTYKDSESGEQHQEFYQDSKANLGDTIYDGKHIIAVDQNAEAYWKGTPQQFCNALNSWRQKMQEQMAAMPAQFRPKQITQQKITRDKLGTKKIAGFKAIGWEFFADGNPSGQVWVSSDSGLSDIIDFKRSQSKKMKCLEEMDSMSIEGAKLYKKTVEDTFVLMESYRQVVSVEHKNVSSNQFKVPVSYKAFSDYDQFVDYVSNHSDAASDMSGGLGDESDEWQQQQQSDNVIVNDVKEIADQAVDEAHQSTKSGVKREISEDVKGGVKKFLDKLF